MKRGMTTGTCARMMNQAIELRDAYTRDFIRQEIEAGALPARVYEARGTSGKHHIKVHPDDFRAWALKRLTSDVHRAALEQALEAFNGGHA